MRVTHEQVAAFHKALHLACNLPALRPTISDERSWWDFLQEMEPLADDPDGELRVRDISAVVRRMIWEVREGKARWSLRPSHILRNPETFRDLVLITRRDFWNKLRPKMPVKRPVTPAPVTEADTLSQEERDASFARMKASLRGNQP